MKLRRAGFTIIELLVVVTFIGLLTRIAVPTYWSLKKRAVAASVIGDVRAVQIAAMSYYAETGEFPPTTGNGKIPAQLVDHLPAGFTFKKTDLTYRWQQWNQSTGKGKAKVTEALVGMRVQSTDQELIATLAKMAGTGFAPVVTKAAVTFMVSTAG